MSDAVVAALVTAFMGLLGTVFVAFMSYMIAKMNRMEEAEKKNSAVIEGVSEANKTQHKLMNSELTDMKRILTEKAMAEGILLGRQQKQAEMDAKALAVAEALKAVQPPASGAESLKASQPPTLVTVVPAAEPLPVAVAKEPKDEPH